MPDSNPIANEVPSGWNLAERTALSFLCSWMFVSCSESHILKYQSSEPETINQESGLNSETLIQLLWAAIVLKCLVVAVWNSFKSLSSDPESKYYPSNEKLTDLTGPV